MVLTVDTGNLLLQTKMILYRCNRHIQPSIRRFYHDCNNINNGYVGDISTKFYRPDTEGHIVTLADFEGAPALLVIFMCNHCPFVKHILSELVELATEYHSKGLAVVKINSNDVANYTEDSPEMMATSADGKQR